VGLISMTGFGRAQGPLAGVGRASVEIRTLNHRFLEVECRLPEGWEGLEPEIRPLVARRIRRGRVRISVAIKRVFETAPASFQLGVARDYARALRALARATGASPQISLETLLGLPHVVKVAHTEGPTQRARGQLAAAVALALEHVARMRHQEGIRLEKQMQGICKHLEKLCLQIERRIKILEPAAASRTRKRLKKLLHEAAEERLIAAQVASWVREGDVSEELTRLRSHFSALKKALQGSVESPGRTIDFLAQELHREVNTLGTKAKDGAIAQRVVAMKNQIEKLREQSSNIE
jgi:uncharacterized protein (TIGR00255 family)